MEVQHQQSKLTVADTKEKPFKHKIVLTERTKETNPVLLQHPFPQASVAMVTKNPGRRKVLFIFAAINFQITKDFVFFIACYAVQNRADIDERR